MDPARPGASGGIGPGKEVIARRPKRLEDYLGSVTTPSTPFPVSWDWIPERIRISLTTLFGVLPVTRSMLDAAGGELSILPTQGEIEYFQRKQTRFQMVNVVISLAWQHEVNGTVSAVPFAVSALPATKRDKVSEVTIDGVVALKGAPVGNHETYSRFDPFRGEWAFYSPMGLIRGEDERGYWLDEMGIVIERYFLALDFDRDDVLEFDRFLPDERSREAYRKSRIRRLFSPFKDKAARRIWGAETPIELFMLQELLYRGLRPELQYLIYPNGSAYPSMYDVYADVEFRHRAEILTEADFYFAEERLAVFCDGAHHSRRKNVEKDRKIDSRLAEIGIQAVRIPSDVIGTDLKKAGDLVSDAIARISGS